MSNFFKTAHSNGELIPLTQLYVVTEATQVIPVILYDEEDELTHTDDHPHCGDTTCPCPCHANTVEGSLAASQDTERFQYVQEVKDAL